MTFGQLRTFLAVAETGSIRAAAEHLVVTQSAVSASLATLQKSLRLRLVEPHGRGLRLTDVGWIYAGYARRILGLLDEAQVAASAEADPAAGQLRLAAVTTAGEHVLPGVLATFHTSYPDVRVALEVGNREQIRTLLDYHEVDLALSGRPADSEHLAVHAVRRNELIVVAPPGSPSMLTGDALLSWLAGQTWVLREPGSGTRATTEAYLTGQQLAPRVLAVSSNAAVRESVAAGLGATLISRDAVARDLADGRLVELRPPGTPLSRDWYLVAHPGRLPATAALLVRHVLATDEFRHAG